MPSSKSESSLTQKIESSRPATTGASTRIDLRTLASLTHFWQQKGQPVRNVSELLRVSLETFLQLLALNDEIRPFDSHEEAYEYLRAHGLREGLRLKKRFLESLSVDALNSLSFNIPVEDAEDEAEKTARRERELDAMKEGLKITPKKNPTTT